MSAPAPRIACPHWSDSVPRGGCALGKAGGRPTLRYCQHCLAGRQVSPKTEPLPASSPTGQTGGPQPLTPERPPVRPCQGCGGAKYNPQDFNWPGGADELIQQLQ